MRTSNSFRKRLQTAAAATRAVVSRADARSRMSRASSRSYLSIPVRSAWPGRTRVTARLRSARLPSAPRRIASVVVARSRIHDLLPVLPVAIAGSSIAIGEPSVSPARTPDRNSTVSFSICMRRPRP